MTVAAGLVCSNGVLLVADTEITYVGGTGKWYESKIFLINRTAGCYFTYTGSPDFAKELADRLRNETRDKEADDIVPVIKREYQAMVDIQRKKKPAERSSAEILATVRRDVREPFKVKPHDYKTTLYQAREDHFFEVSSYAVLGIAEEQGKALFGPLHSIYLSVRENVYFAIYAVQKVKRWIQGVGGETEVIEILNNDSPPFADLGKQEVNQIEDDFTYLEEKLKPLMIALPSAEMSDTNFQTTLLRFTKEMQTRRANRL